MNTHKNIRTQSFIFIPPLLIYWINIVNSNMKKLNRRLTIEQQQTQMQHKLPHLNLSQFSNKLDDLLNKVSVQNRYANRISQCNMNNMMELQKAKKQLHKIEQKKKMNELNATNNQQLLEQMKRKVNTNEQQLKQLFKQLIDARQQIKILKKQITTLQKANLDLEKQLLQIKRQKYYEVSAAKEEIEESMLATHVSNFLSSSPYIHTLLYQFCKSVYKNQNFDHFLNHLDQKIEDRRSNRNRSHASNANIPSRLFDMKLKVSHSKTNEKYKKQRLKTQNLSNEFCINDSL